MNVSRFLNTGKVINVKPIQVRPRGVNQNRNVKKRNRFMQCLEDFYQVHRRGFRRAAIATVLASGLLYICMRSGEVEKEVVKGPKENSSAPWANFGNSSGKPSEVVPTIQNYIVSPEKTDESTSGSLSKEETKLTPSFLGKENPLTEISDGKTSNSCVEDLREGGRSLTIRPLLPSKSLEEVASTPFTAQTPIGSKDFSYNGRIKVNYCDGESEVLKISYLENSEKNVLTLSSEGKEIFRVNLGFVGMDVSLGNPRQERYVLTDYLDKVNVGGSGEVSLEEVAVRDGAVTRTYSGEKLSQARIGKVGGINEINDLCSMVLRYIKTKRN